MVDVLALPVEVAVSVGWLTTLRSSSSGVPANSLRLASCMVETDWTALLAEPGMATRRTTDRVLIVFGRLSSEPVELLVPPESRPARLDSGPAIWLRLSIRL